MRFKKSLTIILSALMVFLLLSGGNTARAQQKSSVPDLQIVTQPNSEYMPGDRISFVVTSPNYTGKVEYRVTLYNGTTKKTTELWATQPGYYYKGWQPAGNYKFTINWPANGMEPGAYNLTVLVRRVGAKVPYDDYVKTNTFWIKENKVKLTVTDIAKNNNSLVLLKSYDMDGEEYGSGSGFIVSADGKVVTNYHVIEKATKIKAIDNNGKEFDVTGLMKYDSQRDIALIYVKDLINYPYLTLGDSSKLAVGDDIVAIGSPMGLQNTVSTGIVSNFRTNIYRKVEGCTDIQISAPVSHGSSGGALFNMYGDVVGMTYAGLMDGQNLNFAIPSNEIKDIIKDAGTEYIPQDKVIATVYDQYDGKDISLSKFSQRLFQYYGSWRAKDCTYELDMIDVYQLEDDTDTVYVNLIVHADRYELFKKPKDWASLRLWLFLIETKVMREYPDKAIEGSMIFQEMFSEKPADYPEDMIYEAKDQYYSDASRKWVVEMPFITFGISSDSLYMGECNADYEFHGYGLYVWEDGDSYEGNWENDKMSGKGTYTWDNGDEYVGEFKDGNFHGQGVLTFADGTKQTGRWENDVYVGE